MKKEYLLYIFVGLIMVYVGCLPADTGQPGSPGRGKDLTTQVRSAVKPYALKLAGWEIGNFISAGGKDALKDPRVTRFSSLPEKISEVLNEENITVFPKVRVKLVEPPLLLVISPRDRIAYYDRILLMPGLSVDVMTQIEEKIDTMDLSSLVVQIGGFGAAYPAVVSPAMTGEHIVNAAVEEWAHQYLAFKPLGFLYLLDSLGLRQDPDVIVMNETLAGMIAREIGDRVYERNYDEPASRKAVQTEAQFNYDKEMRETRRNVDSLLAAGKTGEAEKYMEDRRIDFNRQGYTIRKLNQAYFAFHGIYGQDPGAVSPVYQNMLELRKNYASLAGFVDKMAGMTAYADLERSVSSPVN